MVARWAHYTIRKKETSLIFHWMCKIQHNQINKIYLFRKWSNTCKLHVAERYSLSVVLKNNEKNAFCVSWKIFHCVLYSCAVYILKLCVKYSPRHSVWSDVNTLKRVSLNRCFCFYVVLCSSLSTQAFLEVGLLCGCSGGGYSYTELFNVSENLQPAEQTNAYGRW